MIKGHGEVSSRVKQDEHRHGQPRDERTQAKRQWLRGPRHAAEERRWLKKTWEAAEEFLACSLCVPGLNPSERETIRLRWLEEAQHYDELWRRRRRWDYWIRVPIVMGSITVPVLVSLGVERTAVALVGLAVALFAGMDGVLQFGPRWRQLRQTATLMTQEGWSFLELTGPYLGKTGHEGVYRIFLDRLETLNASQTEGYIRLFHEPRDTKRDGPAQSSAI